MTTSGWEQLDCEFFTEVCRRVLNDYLQDLSFLERRTTPRGGVVYNHSDLFLEFSYDTNLFQSYSIRVNFGIGDGAYSDLGDYNGVPMWYILPKDHPYTQKVHWTFKTEHELESVLAEIQRDFIDKVFTTLVGDRVRLENVVATFQAEHL